MVPQLHVVGEVGHVCDTPVLRGASHSEVAFAPVEARHRVAHAVVLQELHLVRGGDPSSSSSSWRWPVVLGAQGALGAKETSVHELFLLALHCDCRLNGCLLIA
jgi:hypothetical protein